MGLVAGLARLLLVSKETLESVEIERGGSLTDVRLLERVWEHMLQLGGGVRPVFPKLEWVSLRKLDCDGEGLQHILATSPRISHLCLVERLGKAVEPPAEPLVALESL